MLVYPARPAAARSAVNREGSVNGETLVGTPADITAASVELNPLAPREFMLARMVSQIEVDAPPAYLANTEAGGLRRRGDSGV